VKTIASILLFLTSILPGVTAENLRQAQLDDIREAVFRYQLEHARASQKEHREVYFFAVAEKDGRDEFLPLPLGNKRHNPSEDLMSRFKEHKPAIRKNSDLQIRRKDPKRGLRFRATKIQWLSDTEAKVDGGYDDAWGASWATFTVIKENGKWRVISSELKKAWVE
jgi:hypothetical protein